MSDQTPAPDANLPTPSNEPSQAEDRGELIDLPEGMKETIANIEKMNENIKALKEDLEKAKNSGTVATGQEMNDEEAADEETAEQVRLEKGKFETAKAVVEAEAGEIDNKALKNMFGRLGVPVVEGDSVGTGPSEKLVILGHIPRPVIRRPVVPRPVKPRPVMDDPQPTNAEPENKVELLKKGIKSLLTNESDTDTAYVVHRVSRRYSQDVRRRLTKWVRSVVREEYDDGEPRDIDPDTRAFIKQAFSLEDRQKIFTWAANAPGMRCKADNKTQNMFFGSFSFYEEEVRPEIEGYLESGWGLTEIFSLLDLNVSHRFRPNNKKVKKVKKGTRAKKGTEGE